MARVCAIVLAGGSGSRSGRAKQFARAGRRTILAHACQPFFRSRTVHGVVVVVPATRCASVRRELGAHSKLLDVVAGGSTRHLSSRRGLAAVEESFDIVLIHDAARPFVTPALIGRVVGAAERTGAAVPAVAVNDSIVRVAKDHELVEYSSRSELRAVQTPQGFRVAVLARAFARTRRRNFTDDAMVVRAAGRAVEIVPGDTANAKITTAADLARACERLQNV